MAKSVLFLGTSLFAVPSLKVLHADPAFEILGVITQTDKPAGRKKELTPSAVKLEAQKLGLPIFQPENIKKEFSDLMKAIKMHPDFLVVVSYGQILSQEILAYPKIAPINVHASLLPRWRGASPIQHAILEGNKETGVTIQKMVFELDAGPILAQKQTEIGARETFTTLHDRLSEMGADLLMKTLKTELHPKSQSEEGVTMCPKLTREDGFVDQFIMTAEEIDRRVRALNPWPGVTMSIGSMTLKLLETSLREGEAVPAMPCRDGSLLFLKMVQVPGKRPMTGDEWSRGHQKL